MTKTRNLAEILRQEIKSDPSLAAAVEEARFDANIAEEIYNARTRSCKSQTELAELAGMRQSAIARLEDADYGRHSITSLKRIALALGKRLEIKLVDTYVNEKPLIYDQFSFKVEPPSNWQNRANEWYTKIETNTELSLGTT
jgi:transcriptional regulator with XRE-family HTH domain